MVESRKYNNQNNNIKNVSYSMSKSRLKNTKYLNTLGRNARGDAEAKVKEVINLYSESKIPQISTAENMILDLIYNTKTKRQQKTQQKTYEKFITKHQANEPLNKRLTQSKTITRFVIDVISYKLFSRGENDIDEEFKQRKKRTKLYKKSI